MHVCTVNTYMHEEQVMCITEHFQSLPIVNWFANGLFGVVAGPQLRTVSTER